MTTGTEVEYASVRDFLFDEAAMLDDRRYEEWFALLEPDVRYRLSAHLARAAGTPPQEVPLFDDTAADIQIRLKQISNPGMTYAENPPPLMRRFVSNIRVKPGAKPHELDVRSYLMMRRSGGTMLESYTYSVVRSDTLRRVNGVLRLASRVARLDETVITTPNLATFV